MAHGRGKCNNAGSQNTKASPRPTSREFLKPILPSSAWVLDTRVVEMESSSCCVKATRGHAGSQEGKTAGQNGKMVDVVTLKGAINTHVHGHKPHLAAGHHDICEDYVSEHSIRRSPNNCQVAIAHERGTAPKVITC